MATPRRAPKHPATRRAKRVVTRTLGRGRPYATSRPTRADEPAVVRLTGDAAAVLASLADAAELCDATHRLADLVMDAMTGRAMPARSTDRLPDAPLDALAHALPFTAPLAAPLRAAALALSAQAAPAADVLVEADALHDAHDALRAAMEQVREAIGIALPRVPHTRRRALRKDALGRVAALLRETGLEALDRDVLLATDRDGGEVLVSAPIPAATAHVWLLEPLFQRLELVIETHVLLTLERMAAQWQFRRWGGDAPLRDPADAFGRGVREQEYAFVERPTLAYDIPLVVALPDQDFYPQVPARQRALAEALANSWAAVFVVRGRTDGTVGLEDVADGTRLEVHEHNPDLMHAPGFLAIGRVLPLPDGRWLRSPGMAFVSPGPPGQAEALARAIETMRDELGVGLAIEALLATAVTGRRPKLPLSVQAAATKAEARELLQALDEALREEGLVERVPKRELPAAFRKQLPKGAQVRSYTLDRDLGEWLGALSAMVGVAPSRS